MSDPKEFLTRWSQRKREAADKSAPAPANEPSKIEPAPAEAAGVGTTEPSAQLAKKPFDPTTLPSIESLTAASDIRAFLAPGVPAELTRAALRRIWAADPKIRDFIGLAEYAWDFNAPGSIPGFSPLEMTEALQSEIAGMFNPPPSVPAAVESAPRGSPQPTLVAEEFTAEHNPGEASPGAEAQDQEPAAKDKSAAATDMTQCNNEYIAVQREKSEDEPARSTVTRRHGGALPK